ncbi:MAG: hypothetical protein V3S31_03495 [Dehalococcoidia bacterium]
MAENGEPAGVRPGCLVAFALLVLGVIGVLVVGAFLARGDSDIQLGLITDYEPGVVVYFSSDHVFAVHLPDGPVIALSDADPHSGDGESRCTVSFRPDLAGPDGYGRFFDACSDSMYDITGRGLAGDGLDLTRVPVREDGDRLRIRREDAP